MLTAGQYEIRQAIVHRKTIILVHGEFCARPRTFPFDQRLLARPSRKPTSISGTLGALGSLNEESYQ